MLLYLLAYSLTTLAAFGFLAALGRGGEREVTLDDLAGLAATRPGIAFGLTVCMLSLLGFPGTFGFIGKWYILTAVVAAGALHPAGDRGAHERRERGLLPARHHGDVHEVRPDRRSLRRRAAQPRGARRRRADDRGRAPARRVARGHARPRGQERRHAHANGPSVRGTVTAARVAMNVPKSIFRQYDVRGLVGDELTPELARGLGRAFATAGWERAGHAPTIAVGRDNRPSGEALAAGVRRGIVEAGGVARGRRHAAHAGALFRRPARSAPMAASRSPARTIPRNSTASRSVRFATHWRNSPASICADWACC